MARTSRAMRIGLAGLLMAVLVACQPIYRNHGWAPKDADLAEIRVGHDTRDTVREKIGEPGAAGILADSGWYYVESRFEQYGAHAPQEIDRQVVAISFTPRGTVENIERFGLEKGEVVVLSRRVTESGIKGIPFLRQLFQSIGRLNASQLMR